MGRGGDGTLFRIEGDVGFMPTDYCHDAAARHLYRDASWRRRDHATQATGGHNIGIDRNARTLSRFECDYPVELVHGCAHQFLAEYAFSGRELIYSDPPYLHSTRTSTRRYRYDYEEQDPIELLTPLRSLPCAVIISGYPSHLYDELLSEWPTIELQVNNQAGVRTEKLWYNFEHDRVHWHRYVGRNHTHRQQIKRKAENGARRYRAMPPGERLAVLSAVLGVEADEPV